MTQEKVSPLRERMMEDMRIRGMGDKSQKAHIRALKDFTAFLGRSPDTATPDDLRAYQLHMTDTERHAIDFQCPDRGAEVLFRDDLRARRDEEVHAVPHRAAQTADCSQRRGGLGRFSFGARAWPQRGRVR